MYIEKALSLNSKEPNYYRHRAKIYFSSTVNKTEKEKTKLKDLAITDLETSFDLNTNNLATIRNNVPLYFFLANYELSEAASDANVDNKYLPFTLKYFDYTKRYTPNDVGTFVATAKYEKRLNQQESYDKSIQNIKILRPDLLEWHPDLIVIQ
jgi:hypothetical protein